MCAIMRKRPYSRLNQHLHQFYNQLTNAIISIAKRFSENASFDIVSQATGPNAQKSA